MNEVVPAPGDVQAAQLIVAARLVLDWKDRPFIDTLISARFEYILFYVCEPYLYLPYDEKIFIASICKRCARERQYIPIYKK